jgi:hypothetical protein
MSNNARRVNAWKDKLNHIGKRTEKGGGCFFNGVPLKQVDANKFR